MDQEAKASGEALLQAWLSLTAVICNRRMVTGMTFNEAVVCNHLLHQQQRDPDHPLTATDLCEKTSLLKSQMNQVLSSLERQGYVVRSRSRADRRQVELQITNAGQDAYRQAHQNASALLCQLVERYGREAIDALSQQLNFVAADIQEIQDSRQKGTL